jgi:hypothetical protein
MEKAELERERRRLAELWLETNETEEISLNPRSQELNDEELLAKSNLEEAEKEPEEIKIKINRHFISSRLGVKSKFQVSKLFDSDFKITDRTRLKVDEKVYKINEIRENQSDMLEESEEIFSQIRDEYIAKILAASDSFDDINVGPYY